MPEKALAAGESAWRQCDLLPAGYSQSLIEASVDLKPEFHPGKTVLYIISQDCDIVAFKGKEPYVDIVAGERIERAASEYQNTRNPRCLHLLTKIGVISFSIHDKFRIPKGSLAGVIKDEAMQLPPDQRDILKRWVGRRYLRAAFPDAFNKRLTAGTLKELEKTPVADDISVILVWTTDEELPEGTDYHAKLIIGIIDGLSEDRKEEIEKAFETALSPAGIVIDDIRLSDEDDITYRNLRTYKRLEKDYRSLPEAGTAALPPASLDGL
jgi:hypothetical protein